MLGFISKFIKGLILGWIASMVMFFVKRMLTKAFGAETLSTQHANTQRKQNPYKNNSANQNTSDVIDTIWIGMTTDQLLKSIGPALTKQYGAQGEVWTYLNLKGQGVQTHVAIQNGIVANWQDMRPAQPARFAAPRP